MAQKRPLPRHTLAANLARLMEFTGMKPVELARRAGVDRKTISNQLNGRFDPRPEQVDAVAQVFGFNHWDLLTPNFDPSRKDNGMLRKLSEMYSMASEDGKESILRVAEMAATYKK